MVSKEEIVWKRILDTERFKVGEAIKFKWVDLREGWKTYRSERKTWTYGYVTELMISGKTVTYITEVVKGGRPRRGVNIDSTEAIIWCPRKK